MNSSVLITGGCGYIGSHIATELMKHHERVVIIDNLSHSDLTVLDGLERLTGQAIRFYRYDLNDSEQLNRVMRTEQITDVIHCAALKSIPESFSQPALYYENNVNGTINLVQSMRRNGISRIVFSSTASVYADSSQAVTETSPVKILNPYAQTKLVCEEFLSDQYHSDDKWSVGILRYFNPIGAHESALIGELPFGNADNILPLLMDTALGKREYFPILGNDYQTEDGTGIRDYIHVMDLAFCHYLMLQKLRENRCFEILNVGTGRGYSVLHVIHTLEKIAGVRIPTRVFSKRKGDVAVSFANCRKANTLLHWTAQRSLEDMCRDAWKWHQSVYK